jgi:cytochrome c-type biogenesis protein CcmE
MTRKRRRLYVVLLGLSALAVAAALVLTAFEDNIVFFYSPTDVATKELSPDRRIRIGGIVVDDSVKKQADGVTVEFQVTDVENTVKVSYRGILPDLFREGQGIVAGGKLSPGGVFVADEVLAKHDENYMPAEVADALKKAGHWREEAKP